ncbi:MAG TPA: hypothetical protein VF615_07970 [Longimicrobiaceae bacterium]
MKLHFSLVLTDLRRSSLPIVRAAERDRTVARLEEYARVGRFPRNAGGIRAVPIFVDKQGTHCAVGHLLACDGHQNLIAEVSRSRNNAYVRELVHLPGVLRALDGLGITPREAARIQPAYTPGTATCVAYLGFQLFAAVSTLAAVPLLAALAWSRPARARLWSKKGWRRGFSVAVITVGLGGLVLYTVRSLSPPPEHVGMELAGHGADPRRCGDVFHPSTWDLTGWGWL